MFRKIITLLYRAGKSHASILTARASLQRSKIERDMRKETINIKNGDNNKQYIIIRRMNQMVQRDKKKQ